MKFFLKISPASFETLLLAPFRVLSSVCLPRRLYIEIFPGAFFFPLSSPPISQDIAAVNRFTFPHSKVLSAYVFPPQSSLSSLTIWLFLLNLILNWGDRLIQGVTLVTAPPSTISMFLLSLFPFILPHRPALLFYLCLVSCVFPSISLKSNINKPNTCMHWRKMCENRLFEDVLARPAIIRALLSWQCYLSIHNR